VNVDAIPAVLRNCPQWVAWRIEQRKEKRTKPPVDPHTGMMADITNPATWTTFEHAMAFATKHRDADGVGFVFTPEAGIVGIDLDHCVDKETGELAPWAQEIVTALDSFTETSPSGDGLHIYVQAKLPEGIRNKVKIPDDGAVEIYSRARYFTVTGQHFAGTRTGVEERTEQLLAVHAKLFPVRADSGKEEETPAELTAEELDEKLNAAKLHDPVFKRLWDGSSSDYGDDESAADMALCNKLVNLFGRDMALIDAIFRLSKRMREKWAKRADYRQYTLLKALDGGPVPTADDNSDKSKKSAKTDGDKGEDKRNKPKGRSGLPKPNLRDVVLALTEYAEFQDFWYDDFL
jgi:primase-polymerase (primpol)-like protein